MRESRADLGTRINHLENKVFSSSAARGKYPDLDIKGMNFDCS
jgi:hypothetical protein